MAFEILKRIFGREVPAPDPEDPNFYTRGQASPSALAAIPAAYACMNVLSQALAGIRGAVATLEDATDDYWILDGGHPVSELLRSPTSLMDPWQFWENLFYARFRDGAGYAFIRREDGAPVELIPAAYNHAEHMRVNGGYQVVYDLSLMLVDPRTGVHARVKAPAPDVVVLAGPGFDGFTSPSPIQYAASRILDIASTAMDAQKEMLLHPNMTSVIQTDPELVNLTRERRRELQKELAETHFKARQSGLVPVLPPGFLLAAHQGLSAVDLRIIELLKWTVEDTARVFNVPPRMIGHYHDGFRPAKFEYQQAEFDRVAVLPEAKRVQEQLGFKLLSMADRDARRVVRLPTDRVRQGSWSEEVAATDQAVSRGGLLTPNEGRRRLRYPPIAGGDTLYKPKGAPDQDSGGGGDNSDNTTD